MKIDFQGRVYQLDADDITNRQAEKIHAVTGLTVKKWLDSLAESDAMSWESSWSALYWLMLLQNGETVAGPEDVEFPVYRFMEAYLAAAQAEAKPAQEAEPDPTRLPAGLARSPASRSRKPTSPSGVAPDG